MQSFGAAYVAYVVLNLLILCCSFHVFRRIYQAHQPADQPDTVAIVAVSFATLMIATYPVTTHVLSPHTQLFNTLVPLLALLFAMQAHDGALEDIRFAVMVGAIVGFGQTAYGVFLVISMTVLLFAGVQALRKRRGAATLLLLRNGTVLVALSAAPTMMWYAFIRISGNEFHFHEVENDKSFIWIITSLQKGTANFVSELSRRLEYQIYGLTSLLPMIKLMALVMIGFLIAGAVVLGRHKIMSVIREVRWTLGIALIVGVIFFSFYVCVGTFQVRLSYPALPPLIAGGGALATTLAARLPTTWRRSFGGVCGAIALLVLVLAIAEGRRQAGDWFD